MLHGKRKIETTLYGWRTRDSAWQSKRGVQTDDALQNRLKRYAARQENR